MSTDDIDEQREHLRQLSRRFKNSGGTLHALADVVRGMRALTDALGYRDAYGKAIEYDGDSSTYTVYARVADDEYSALPGLSVTLPAGDVRAQHAALHELVIKVLYLPTHAEHKLGKWKQKLADLTAEGERLEVGIEYVEMLRATAMKLSTNILMHRKDEGGMTQHDA